MPLCVTSQYPSVTEADYFPCGHLTTEQVTGAQSGDPHCMPQETPLRIERDVLAAPGAAATGVNSEGHGF